MLTSRNMKFSLGALVESGKTQLARGTAKDSWDRIKNIFISFEDYKELLSFAQYIGVTEEFAKVLNTFPTPAGELPAGFRHELICKDGKCIHFDLKRDISYAKNGAKRPTNVLFSADSANPYEVEPLKNIVANLTCNPFIVYSQFINNPKANIGNKFKDRDEVMKEIGRILGPGADISVEVNDPFADFNQILEEIACFEEILTPYRLVIKIPHTGPINKGNVNDLVSGSFTKGFEEGTITDNLYGHNLAYALQERGYRINFTLMFEPHQTAIAMQARPYFINTFIKARYYATLEMKRLVDGFDKTGDKEYFRNLKTYMINNDMLSQGQAEGTDDSVLSKARWMLVYHQIEGEGFDGLDSSRHSIRLLRNANLPDTRLIICSMDGEQIFPYIDKMLMEPEFADMTHRVVVTAPPAYLARFASAPGVLTYQRMFLKAAGK
jgi:hypothetical protein